MQAAYNGNRFVADSVYQHIFDMSFGIHPVFDQIIDKKHHHPKHEKCCTREEEICNHHHIQHIREPVEHSEQESSHHGLTESYHGKTSKITESHMTDDDPVGSYRPYEYEREEKGGRHPYAERSQ